MRRSLLIVALAFGTLAGYGSGIARVLHHHHSACSAHHHETPNDDVR
jgi:hypothetical protein